MKALKNTAILVSLLFLTCFGVKAQVSNQLEMLDIFNLEYVSDPQISPDGQQIIYVRNFKDIMNDQNLSNLWIARFDGSQNRPLTTGEQSDRSPRWSHDGKKIIYTSSKSGKSEIYLRWMDSGDEMVLVNSEKSPSNVTWSPDDKHLAFSMFVPKTKVSPIKMPAAPKGAKWNSPPKYIDELSWRRDGVGELPHGNQQLFTVPVSGGTPRQITDTAFDHGSAVWGKDGKHLYFSANMRADKDFEGSDSDIYSISLSTGELNKLTSRYGPDGNPTISPDGKKMAYLGYDDKYNGYQISRLYIADIDGKNSQLVSGKLDRDVGSIKWASDGKGLYFQYVDKSHTKIAYITTKGKVSDITEGLGGVSLGRPYTSGAFSIADNGNYAYTWAETYEPSDLGVGNKGNNRRVTKVNEDLFDYKQLGSVEEIWYKSSADGLDINGWIVKPADFDPNKKYPMIAYFYERRSNSLHSHPSPAPSASTINIPYYVSNDYLVLVPDIKYEVGYPGKSAMDHVVPATKAVMAMGFVDEDNMAIQGQSWGGYQVAHMVTRTNLYKAAGAGAPVVNMTSAYGGVRWASGMSRMFQYEKTQTRLGATLWDRPDLYIENSPLFKVPEIETPMFIMHNDADGAVPWYQGIEFYMSLRRLQKPAWLVSYNDEAHNLTRRKNRKDLSIRMAQFFNHYLKGEPMPEWMAYGLPAKLKGRTLRYDLVDETEEKVTEGESLKLEKTKGGQH